MACLCLRAAKLTCEEEPKCPACGKNPIVEVKVSWACPRRLAVQARLLALLMAALPPACPASPAIDGRGVGEPGCHAWLPAVPWVRDADRARVGLRKDAVQVRAEVSGPIWQASSGRRSRSCADKAMAPPFCPAPTGSVSSAAPRTRLVPAPGPTTASSKRTRSARPQVGSRPPGVAVAGTRLALT